VPKTDGDPGLQKIFDPRAAGRAKVENRAIKAVGDIATEAIRSAKDSEAIDFCFRNSLLLANGKKTALLSLLWSITQ